jgi:hypothetical protein
MLPKLRVVGYFVRPKRGEGGESHLPLFNQIKKAVPINWNSLFYYKSF